ncbi:MAG: class II aldolase/adducin family protein [Acetobacteraceae bacterium]
MSTNSACEAVHRLYQDLGARRLIVGSAGNVSLRVPEGMVVTPSGGSPEGVSAREMVVVRPDGQVLSGSGTPSSESPMHAAIYQAYPAAGCIIHTHADACTALACLNQDLPAFHYMVVQFGGETVRCAPYVTFGTPALADLAVKALEGRTACLLANHGMIVFGDGPDQALARAVLLETLCRQFLMARAAGTPRLLTNKEMAAAKQRFRTYGSRPDAER